MILADTSVWIDHLNLAEPEMTSLLNVRMVAMHPFVVGELSLGPLRNRTRTLADLDLLPRAERVAQSNEVRHMIEQHRLYNRGIGWIDANLIATVAINDQLKLWTRDKPLRKIAEDLGLHGSFK
jgi:hypothetical protein